MVQMVKCVDENMAGKKKVPTKMIRLYGEDDIVAYKALKSAHFNMAGLIRALIRQAATERVGWQPKTGGANA